MSFLNPFSAWSGPRHPSILFLAEAWGREEDIAHQPLAGVSGKELWRMIGEAFVMPDSTQALHSVALEFMKFDLAWLAKRPAAMEALNIAYTNVFNLRPNGNKLDSLCCQKGTMPSHKWPKITRDLHLRDEFLPHLARLRDEIAESRPNLIVALGNTACWALLRTHSISSIRGTAVAGHPDGLAPGVKILPTYHPASLFYEGRWNVRPIICADLVKAQREGGFAGIRRPSRQVLINPTLDEVRDWIEMVVADNGLCSATIACDIETKFGQITCIGFARSRSDALVVPFVDLAKPSGSYWASPTEEREVWKLVNRLLTSGLPLVFQNGIYDLQYLFRAGFRPANVAEDTMLLHHSLFPEMLKGLGFLGSIYSSEPAWKLMRMEKADTTKRDE